MFKILFPQTLQCYSCRIFVNEGNLREVKTSNALTHPACAKRTWCNYPSCNLNHYLDSKSFTPLKKKKRKKTLWLKMKERRQTSRLGNRNKSKKWPCLSDSLKWLHYTFSWMPLCDCDFMGALRHHGWKQLS